MNKIIIWTILLFTNIVNISVKAAITLNSAGSIDIKKYIENWYEMSKIPKLLEENCSVAKLRYKEKECGSIEIVSICVSKNDNRIIKTHKISFILVKDKSLNKLHNDHPFLDYYSWSINSLMELLNHNSCITDTYSSKEFIWDRMRMNYIDEFVYLGPLDIIPLHLENNKEFIKYEQSFDEKNITKQIFS